MNSLPLPPSPMSFEDIRVEFVSITEGDPQRGFVPGYRFRILNADGMDIGHVNFRVGDTEHVRLAAGHIGFEIAEEYRGNRCASKACLALASWIATFNEHVLITADPDNLASIRTIERIGGVFLDEVDVPQGDPHLKLVGIAFAALVLTGLVRGYFVRRRGLQKGWSVGHLGRDEMYYEEMIHGKWERIRIDGEMLLGTAHHIIYFPTPEQWRNFPDWTQGRQEEIIARIKEVFTPPEYEYYESEETITRASQ